MAMSRKYICDMCKMPIEGTAISVREKVYISLAGEAPTKAESVEITDYCEGCFGGFKKLKNAYDLNEIGKTTRKHNK